MLRPRWRRHARGRAVSVRSSRSAAERRPRAERLDGVHCVLEALRAQRRDLRRLLVSPVRGGRPGTDLAQVLDAAEAAGVPVEWVEPDALHAAEGRGNPQRVVLETGPLPELALDALLEGTPGQRRLVVLDGVEDPQNLGALARVAEASGAIGLVLGERRAAPLGPAASRASAGALEWLPVARVGNLTRAIEIAKTRGFWVIAADQRAPDSLFEVERRVLSGDLAVVLGSEGKGLRPLVASMVDHRVRIPLLGRVESLNVATAGAVMLFELMRIAAATAPAEPPRLS